jgi:hypothetical protein
VLGGREITWPARTSIVSFSDCRSRTSSADGHSWNLREAFEEDEQLLVGRVAVKGRPAHATRAVVLSPCNNDRLLTAGAT